MNFARKLMLLAVMAIAALAMTASSASAVEITEEGVGHCSAVTAPTHTDGDGDGGCAVHAVSNGQVELGSPAGMILCNNEFEARIDEAGAGYIYMKNLTNCNVPTVPCEETVAQHGETGPEAWPVNLQSTTSLEARFCVVVGGALVVRCHLFVDVAQVSHAVVNFRTGLGTPPPHRNCEEDGLSVGGSWTAHGR